MSERFGGYRMLTILAGIVTVVGLVATITLKVQTASYASQLGEIESETDRRLGIAPTHEEAVHVAAPFVTWADLVESLHRAGAAAGLSEFGYVTQQTYDVDHPSESLPDDEQTTADAAAAASERASPDAPGVEADAPRGYTAMTAVVEGVGPFGAITYFVELLGVGNPPLTLDRLEIGAGTPPSFVAHVHMDSALPIAEPERIDEGATVADDEGDRS